MKVVKVLALISVVFVSTVLEAIPEKKREPNISFDQLMEMLLKRPTSDDSSPQSGPICPLFPECDPEYVEELEIPTIGNEPGMIEGKNG